MDQDVLSKIKESFEQLKPKLDAEFYELVNEESES